MAIRYEKIEKTKNSKSFFGYKTKELVKTCKNFSEIPLHIIITHIKFSLLDLPTN